MKLKNNIHNFFSGQDNTRVGVVVFSNLVELRIRLNQFQDDAALMEAISNLNYIGGTTNTPGNYPRVFKAFI